MSEIDHYVPLLPATDQPYIVTADKAIYLLRTPPGAEHVFLFNSAGERTDLYYSGIGIKRQGVFDTEMKIRFRDQGNDDEYTIVMEYGIPYLRPTWHFKLIGRDVVQLPPPIDYSKLWMGF